MDGVLWAGLISGAALAVVVTAMEHTGVDYSTSRVDWDSIVEQGRRR